MPATTMQLSDLHWNQPLTSVSVAFMQSEEAFVADRVFPFVPSDAMSGVYWKYPAGTFFRTDVEVRAPGAPAARSSYKTELDSFVCDPYAIAEDIPDQHRANADNVFNLDRNATIRLTRQMLLRRELAWANTYFKTGVWDTLITGVASGPGANQTLQFSASGSDPISFTHGRKIAMLERTGIEPNTLVITPYVLVALLNNPLVLDRIKYVQAATPMSALNALASLLDIPRILVAKSVVNTANEASDSTPTNGFVFGKAALLCYAATEPGVETPSAGYTFGWTGLMGGQAKGLRVKTYRDERLAATSIEVEAAWQQKVVATSLGEFWSSIVS